MPALKIQQIERSGGTQIRSQYDGAAIQRYKEVWEARIELPPVIVFYDGTKYWLADGFHRVEAKWSAELPLPQAMREIECDVRSGTQRDAVKYALGANSDHGLPRTGEDIRRAIARCLDDAEWSELTNVAISKICKCSESMVRKVKTERDKAKQAIEGQMSLSFDRLSKPEFTDPESADLHSGLLVLPMKSILKPLSPSTPTKQFEPTIANPETAPIGEVLATAVEPDLLVNKNQEFWDAVPDLAEPLFETPTEIAPCEFKVDDRVIDAADNRAGSVTSVFKQAGSWYLDVELDSGYHRKGAAESWNSEPKPKQLLLYVYILVKPELGDLVATYTKKNGYQYDKLEKSIGQNNLVMSGMRSVVQTIADKEGGVVKTMIVTVED
jgi:hypothetical protein